MSTQQHQVSGVAQGPPVYKDTLIRQDIPRALRSPPRSVQAGPFSGVCGVRTPGHAELALVLTEPRQSCSSLINTRNDFCIIHLL